jgi:hypothetical protein
MVTGDNEAASTSAPNVQFLLGLANKRLSDVTKALERNWIVHLIIAGIGTALVFDIGDLPKFLSRYVSQDEYDLKPAATIVLAVLLYQFMKLGHLLTAFVELRHLTDALLRQRFGNHIQTEEFKPLRETTSYFEGYFSADAFGGRGRPVMTLYYLLSGAVIATSQAAALALIVKAYGINIWSISAIVSAAIIMGMLYWAFWRSKKDLPGTTPLVLASSLGAVALFFVFSSLELREATPQSMVLAPTTNASPSAPKKIAPSATPQTQEASTSSRPSSSSQP